MEDGDKLKQLVMSEAAQQLVKRWGQWQLEVRGRPRTRALSTPSSARSSSSSRRAVKPNSAFPVQAAVKMTNERRLSPASGAPASPSTTAAKAPLAGVDSGVPPSPSATAAKAPMDSADQSQPAPADGNRNPEVAELVKRIAAVEQRMKDQVGALEQRVLELEAKNAAVNGELKGMRDKMEEGEWARKRLEDKVKEQEEEVKRELEGVKKDRKDWDDKVTAELSEIKQGVADLVSRVAAPTATAAPTPTTTMPTTTVAPERRDDRQRVIIFADSNGKETTEEEIMSHIVREERDRYDIKVIPAFHAEDVFKMVRDNQVDVDGAILVIDCLTNDVRGTKRKSAIGPEELIRQVDLVRGMTQRARETVLCQVKPMRRVDVTRHNALLHEYLCAQGSFGCQTMIRSEYLKWDGFHILPQYKSVLHRQFACALLGIPVPCPTPFVDFVSGHIGRQHDQEWPTLSVQRSEGSNAHYG